MDKMFFIHIEASFLNFQRVQWQCINFVSAYLTCLMVNKVQLFLPPNTVKHGILATGKCSKFVAL